jgi:hypothetical protein
MASSGPRPSIVHRPDDLRDHTRLSISSGNDKFAWTLTLRGEAIELPPDLFPPVIGRHGNRDRGHGLVHFSNQAKTRT